MCQLQPKPQRTQHLPFPPLLDLPQTQCLSPNPPPPPNAKNESKPSDFEPCTLKPLNCASRGEALLSISSEPTAFFSWNWPEEGSTRRLPWSTCKKVELGRFCGSWVGCIPTGFTKALRLWAFGSSSLGAWSLGKRALTQNRL